VSNEIAQLEPPAIPLAQNAYHRSTVDQTNNVLRLFFNKLVQLIRSITDRDAGGRALYMPYGDFYDTTTQTAALADTAYALTFGTSVGGSGVSVVSSSRITVEYDGLYYMSIYGHINTTGAAGEITLWAKKNGTNLADSARKVDATADLPIEFSGVISLVSGDYIEFFWETTNTNARFETVAAGTNYPATPSVSCSVVYAGNN